MTNRLGVAGLIAMLAAVPPLSAQWPSYPTGAPRNPAGALDLTAPTPRSPDGKPDLSGLWESVRTGPGQRIVATDPEPAAVNYFWNIGSAMKEGLPYQPWAAALRQRRMAENQKDNPDVLCLPIGLTQLHNHPQPRKIIQTPRLIVILYEANGGVRQIFMDGRPLPGNDPQPWWYGYSVGRWDGDTLVVETTGFRDEGWLDVTGSPLTDAAKMTERFRRADYGHLEIQVTVDDPKAYTKPWSVTLNQRVLPDAELIEFVCAENEKSSRHFQK
ncbi:MAG: hypothetical protein ABI868_18700 [Acidobacteriota bacterium]